MTVLPTTIINIIKSNTAFTKIWPHSSLSSSLLVFCILLSFAGQAQTGGSENGNIAGLHAQDTTSINKVFKIALALRETGTDSAIGLYQQALASSKVIGYRFGMAKALQGLGRCYSNKNEQDKAVGYLRNALHYNDSTNAGRELAIVDYLILSETFYNKGQLDSCAWYRYEALNELENGRPQSAETQMRVYGKILHFWMNAHEDVSNDPFVAQMIGHINRIEKLALETKDSTLLANVYFYKAGYYVNIKRYDSAHIYSDRNLAISRITKAASPSVIMAMLINTATIYLEENKPVEAIATLQEAVSFVPLAERGNNRYVILAGFFLGEAYLQLEQFQKAVDITMPALAKAEALQLVRNTERPHKTLADAYEALGDFKQAAFHRKAYVNIRDSMVKEENLEIIYNTEMKYRIADREKALVQKELIIAQNEGRIKTKNSWIVAITSVFLLISVLGLLLYRNKSHKEKLQSEKLRNLQQEMEISRLNAMITGEEKERSRIARDLHDGLGGTMGAIRTKLSAVFRKHKTTDVTSDFVDVMHMMEEASMELRKTAHNLMPEVLLQEGLVKATELYCERVSKDRGLAINFETWGTQERLKPDFELAVYRIIQELVHNILKHAHASQAIVQITFHETQLCITIEDDGVGMSGKQSDGMGLKAIKERVIPLNGQISIESGFGKGTSVYLEFTMSQKSNSQQQKNKRFDVDISGIALRGNLQMSNVKSSNPHS